MCFSQMDTAMMLHFNVNTPHQEGPAGFGTGLQPRRLRPAKRSSSPSPSDDPASSVDGCGWQFALLCLCPLAHQHLLSMSTIVEWTHHLLSESLLLLTSVWHYGAV